LKESFLVLKLVRETCVDDMHEDLAEIRIFKHCTGELDDRKFQDTMRFEEESSSSAICN